MSVNRGFFYCNFDKKKRLTCSKFYNDIHIDVDNVIRTNINANNDNSFALIFIYILIDVLVCDSYQY